MASPLATTTFTMGASQRNRSTNTLERLLAEEVLRALVERQHLRIAHASQELLRDELEASIAPMLTSITPYLMAAHAAALLEFDASVHADRPEGFGDGNANEAVAVMVDGIGERLSHSNHVDDIFADDSAIRRIALRSVRRVLLGYLRGELAIEADSSPSRGLQVSLDGLGYIVETAVSRADESTLHAALVRSGRTCGADFVSFDRSDRSATFRPRRSHASLLALEDAITAQITELIEAGHLELPNVQQEFELPTTRLGRGVLVAALRTAALELERRAACRARGERVGSRRIRLSVTPLTTETAQHADALFEQLVALVETALDRPTPMTPDLEAPESVAAESQTRRRAAASAQPASGSAKPRAVASRRPSSRRKAKAG
jgi:hypothetical protein